MSQKRRAEVEVGWRVVRARWMVESDRACVDGRGDGFPSPEVLRRVQREERKRERVNFVYKSGTARRMLKLLMEQRRRRARARDRGRVRLALVDRFEQLPCSPASHSRLPG